MIRLLVIEERKYDHAGRYGCPTLTLDIIHYTIKRDMGVSRNDKTNSLHKIPAVAIYATKKILIPCVENVLS